MNDSLEQVVQKGLLGKLRDFFARSLIYKVGIPLVALFLLGSSLLFVSSYLTSQLMGTTTTINLVGMQRARIYKIASLLQQLSSSTNSKADDTVVREEMARWKRAMEHLRFEFGAAGEDNPQLSVLIDRYREVRHKWFFSLKPILERSMENNPRLHEGNVEQYLQQADAMVEALSEIVVNLEESRESQIQRMYVLQLIFLVCVAMTSIGVMVFLNRMVRIPLKQLTRQAERLGEGDLSLESPLRSVDEFGQLSRAFHRLVEGIREKIGEIETLHKVGKEICTFGVESSVQVLHRLTDRAVDLMKVDVSVLMVRHSSLQSWVIEAASGSAFDEVHKEIWLLEETPFSNQAYDTLKPVVISDLNAHEELPVRFRDFFGAKSVLIVPLLRPHECIGVMVFLSTKQNRNFSDWEVRFAQHFSSYAAITIENARLFDVATSESSQLRIQLDNLKRDITELTHEVQAPAGRVAEFASWIEQDYGDHLDGKGRKYLDWIKKEGRDLAQLADRTIGLARLNAPNDPLQCVAVKEVVTEVLNLLDKEISNRSIRVILAEEFPLLACRRIHLKQVVENLISNAIKFMGEQPSPVIEIGVEPSEAGPMLFVRDNGIGMDPSCVEKVFRPFHRLATIETPGSGIGLAIVKTVIEQYGGSMTVTTSPGQGSLFRFRLPVLRGKDIRSHHRPE